MTKAREYVTRALSEAKRANLPRLVKELSSELQTLPSS